MVYRHVWWIIQVYNLGACVVQSYRRATETPENLNAIGLVCWMNMTKSVLTWTLNSPDLESVEHLWDVLSLTGLKGSDVNVLLPDTSGTFRGHVSPGFFTCWRGQFHNQWDLEFRQIWCVCMFQCVHTVVVVSLALNFVRPPSAASSTFPHCITGLNRDLCCISLAHFLSLLSRV